LLHTVAELLYLFLDVQLEVMNEFFAANGTKHLLIYYEQSKEVDSGKLLLKELTKKLNYFYKRWQTRQNYKKNLDH